MRTWDWQAPLDWSDLPLPPTSSNLDPASSLSLPISFHLILRIQGDHANPDCLGLPGLRLPQFNDLELAIFDEGLSCIRPFLYSIPKCHFEKLIDNTQL